jgi:NTP pyrophosphatase (non-canonical NTP hydrolase)
MGVVEEVGELSHAMLKQSQGIRGSYELHESEMEDAVGDILIYLTGFCSAKGWDMAEILETTAENILARDWIRDPVEGTSQ